MPRVVQPKEVEVGPPRVPGPTQPPRAPTPPPSVRISPPPKGPPEAEGEILNLMSNITKYYERKASLLDLFKSQEVSDRVFLKLYGEYSDRLNDVLNRRTRKIEELRKDFEGKSKRLEGIKMAMEELEVRHKIGEMDTQRFNERMNSLKMEGNELQTVVRELKTELDHLEKPLTGKTARDVLDLDMKTRSCYEVLGKLVEEGKLQSETLEKIKPDIEKMLEFFDSIIKERKEQERTLGEQLETLQARYRISEMSIEEYERRKRELQEEIDKIWT